MRKIGNFGNARLQKEQFNILVDLLEQTSDRDEIEALFMTVLTESERAVISQRLAIVRMIIKGFKYYDIEEKLKVSSSTIIRASDQYNRYGQFNHTFNELLAKFKFDSKKYEKRIVPKYPNRGKIEPFVVGTRGLIRENIKNGKKYKK